MHSLQPCQLGNDSLLNMVLYPLLDMRGGAPLCTPLKMPGGFGVAPSQSLGQWCKYSLKPSLPASPATRLWGTDSNRTTCMFQG